MHAPEYIFILLAVSLVLITVMRRIQVPTIFGYLALGMLLGPESFDFFSEDADIAGIAELGIMAIMFSIGLEFSFSRLITSRRYVFGIGGIQVSVCGILATLVMKFIFGYNWHDSLLTGAIISLSSTAVVSKMLIEEGLLSSPQGTRSICVLIFQDLAFIPMLVLANYSSGGAGASGSVTSLLLSSIGILFVILVIMPRIMPHIVSFFADQGSNEIFTIFVLTLIMSISIITYKAGLSLALGSFLAGMLLSESRHRYIIHDIVTPFREIFLGFFFVSIGLLIKPSVFAEFWVPVVLGSLAVLMLKPVVIYATVKLFGSHHWTAIYSGVALGGTGEFGFVLLTAAAMSTDSELLQILFAINLVCMALSPIMVTATEKIKNQMLKQEWLIKARDATRAAQQSSGLHNHIILAGFGQNSRIITRLLNKHSIPWIAVEHNYQLYNAANKAGLNVIYGDTTHEDTLLASNIVQAKAMVMTHGLQHVNIRTVMAVRQLNSKIPIFARVEGQSEIAEAQEAGISHMAVGSLEVGTSLAKRILHEYEVVDPRANYEITLLKDEIIKEGGMSMIQDMATSYYDSEEADRRRPQPYMVTKENNLTGKTLHWLKQLLQEHDIEFLRLERNNELVSVSIYDLLEEGDRLMLEANDYQLDAFANHLFSEIPQNQQRRSTDRD